MKQFYVKLTPHQSIFTAADTEKYREREADALASELQKLKPVLHFVDLEIVEEDDGQGFACRKCGTELKDEGLCGECAEGQREYLEER